VNVLEEPPLRVDAEAMPTIRIPHSGSIEAGRSDYRRGAGAPGSPGGREAIDRAEQVVGRALHAEFVDSDFCVTVHSSMNVASSSPTTTESGFHDAGQHPLRQHCWRTTDSLAG
jgi:hypothetical protein